MRGSRGRANLAAPLIFEREKIFTTRRYASAVYAVLECLSVRPSVCLSQAGTVLKRLNIESLKQRYTIAQLLWFSDAKNLGEFPTESTHTGTSNKCGVGSFKLADIRPTSRYISETVQDRDILLWNTNRKITITINNKY